MSDPEALKPYVYPKVDENRWKKSKKNVEFKNPRSLFNDLAMFHLNQLVDIKVQKYKYKKSEPESTAIAEVEVLVASKSIAWLEIKGTKSKKKILQVMALELISLLFPGYYKLYPIKKETKFSIKQKKDLKSFNDMKDKNISNEIGLKSIGPFEFKKLVKKTDVRIFFDFSFTI